jgi:hypothetical protein
MELIDYVKRKEYVSIRNNWTRRERR